ncbi:MAG: Do family serine endopeptidase [Proteobacteria bacterium]|nr:Do family serine endopeptidase [Pseudomonadota bacterium]
MRRHLMVLFFLAVLLIKPLYSEELKSFSQLVKKVEPTVVNISTTQIIKAQRPTPFDFFKEFFGESPFDFDMPKDFQRQSLGSGVIISEDGYILTNHHVIKDASIIKVRLYRSKEDIEAVVVGKDPKIDIALLKINRDNLPFARLGDSDKLEVGDWVIAIGNPFGLSHTVTKGIVSAKGRVIGSGPYDDFIQTDTPINFGNSGGPLFNLNGEIVGINTAIIAGGQNIGFSIPINMVKTILPQLKKGIVERAYLGIKFQEVTKEIAESFGFDKTVGVLVSEVVKNSPAEKAGIKEGDIILDVNGKTVDEFTSFPKIIASYLPGDTVKLKIYREKKEVILSATLGKQSEQGTVLEKLGLRLSESKSGIVVEEVQPHSIASSLKIVPGDIIISVNNQKVETIDQLVEIVTLIPKNSAVTIQLRTKQGNKFVSFRMP